MFSEFFSFLKLFVGCCTVFFCLFLVLLALPKSAMRSVALEVSKWVLSGVFAFLVASPIDVVPDVVPVLGWADDIGYVVGAIAAARSAMGERKQRRFLEACENARLARMAGLDSDETEPTNGHGTDRGAA